MPRGLALVALGLAIPALLLVVGRMAVASFGAAEALGVNLLQAGTVDVTVGRVVTAVEVTNIAPGDRHVIEVDVGNAGTLPLALGIELTHADAELARALDWVSWTGDCQDPTATGAARPGLASLPLAPAERQTLCISAGLGLDAPNELQGVEAAYLVVLTGVHDTGAG